MKATLGLCLMVASPFIVGALILALIKGQELYANWRYECAVQKRNAKLASYSITPFRGVRSMYDDQH